MSRPHVVVVGAYGSAGVAAAALYAVARRFAGRIDPESLP
jgi:precorrin isomerase